MRHLEHEKLTFCDPKRKIVLVRAIKTKTQKVYGDENGVKRRCRRKKEVGKQDTDVCCLTTGICSEKCVVGRIGRCAKVYLHKPK